MKFAIPNSSHKYRWWYAVGALAVGTLAVGFVLLTPSSAPATPTIAWTPTQVSQTILAGETKTVTVAFTPSETASNVTLRVVPALQPFVHTTPTQFLSITKGQPIQVTVKFSAPATALPSTVPGTIQLRSGSGNNINTLAQPLPVTVSIVWNALTTPSGAKVVYPPDWIVQTGDRGTTITTLSNPALLDEDTVRSFAFFNVETVRPRPGTSATPANPAGLPIDQWFDQYFSQGFPAPPVVTQVLVGGRSAIRLEMAEVGGRYAHIYVPNGLDVVEISFNLSASFTPAYETMLSTITF